MADSMSAGKINSLQLLRALAALLVVYCHTLDRQPETAVSGSFQQHFFYLQNFGAVGVDIFFVISGFIITIISTQYAAHHRPGYFLARRLVRIVPVYWLVSLVPLLYGIKNGQPVISGAIKTIFFFPFFDHGFFDTPLLAVGWTLSFEMFFYIVVYAAMLITRRWHIQLAMVFLLSLIGISYITQADNPFIFFFGNGIVIEFLMGALAGLVFLSPVTVKPPVATFFLATGAIALLAGVFFGYGSISEAWAVWNRSIVMQRVLMWGLPAALLVAGSVFKEKEKPVTNTGRWLILPGDASYSIYLIHIIILEALYARWSRWGLLYSIPPDVLIGISVLLTALSGCIFYKIIELPLLKFLNRKLGISKTPSGLPHRTGLKNGGLLKSNIT